MSEKRKTSAPTHDFADKAAACFALAVHPKLTSPAKAIGAILIYHSRPGKRGPTIEQLADRSGWHVATVFRALNQLEALSLIVRAGLDVDRCNVYRIDWVRLNASNDRADLWACP